MLLQIFNWGTKTYLGFEYDIFISYRHNDNRSGLVKEFVNALREELSATIKEPLSIYFDQNPHDGLLETHNVDKRLNFRKKILETELPNDRLKRAYSYFFMIGHWNGNS